MAELKKTVISVKMKSKHYANTGKWDGSILRGAISESIASAICKHNGTMYKKCDTCTNNECTLKKTFYNKTDSDKKYFYANPIIVSGKFSRDINVSTELNFDIIIFGNDTRIDDITENIKQLDIKYDGEITRFELVEIEANSEILNTDIVFKEAEHVEKLRICFDTPYISSAKSRYEFGEIVRACTTRITSIMNSCCNHEEFNYRYFTEDFTKSVSNEEGKQPIYSIDNNGVIETGRKLSYTKNWRFSTRDEKDHCINGAVGYLEFTGNLSKYINILEFASKLNIGKSCTMGFGKFHIEYIK